MKQFIFIAIFIFPLYMAAQNASMYVAAKAGLSIRDKPNEQAKVIGKIPYATKLIIGKDATTETRIITEGFYGYWTKVTYGQLTGYIVNSYLLSVPPPKATIKSMKEYLLQLSPVFGAQLIVKTGTTDNIESTGMVLKKQLYKNGSSYHEYSGYEYSAESCFIPGITTKEAFLLIRLIPEFANAFTDKDPFPLTDKKYKRNDADYDLKVEKEVIGDEPWIKKIHIEFTDGSSNSLEIFQLEGEVVIVYSSGV